MATTLNIIESAYRATMEEQNDTVVWISHAMKGAGADLTVLLRGNAVNYAVLGQVSPALAFGDWKQTHAAHLDEDIASLISKGVDVYAVEDDFAARGISLSGLIPGVKTVNREGLLDLVENHDRVWHW
ncbi:MAG TPA: DsrH/TusB family sulfur metabolism protein [Nitrospinota bacterium]|jgi:intracellular sulfur oxidation DsrE/DsrF family protein|nr:DsrH/TusB family sulfur metabolism protein [Nitrospinota bacterium]|tara:strand:- start:1354 stop:1737 length:384 start_codon:yes stop_codon:yes gene_type:complete